MLLSLLASVEVKLFHATEVYSSLDVTKVKYNIRRMSIDEKEDKVGYSTNKT
jgi:hypothetical protein